MISWPVTLRQAIHRATVLGMKVTVRRYDHTTDYSRVGQFLIDTYQPGDQHDNWLQPRWEYMHYHPLFD